MDSISVRDRRGGDLDRSYSQSTHLMKLGFVHRCKSDDDGRVFELNLTRSGQKQLDTAKPQFEHLDRMLDAALSPKELHTLNLLLMRVSTAFADA